jgi:hypothetical protein
VWRPGDSGEEAAVALGAGGARVQSEENRCGERCNVEWGARGSFYRAGGGVPRR